MNYILLMQKKKAYMKCDALDVEPCAGTDVPDTPTVGIMVEDTDGECIEMKNKRNILPLLAQYNNSVKRIIKTNRYKTR